MGHARKGISPRRAATRPTSDKGSDCITPGGSLKEPICITRPRRIRATPVTRAMPFSLKTSDETIVVGRPLGEPDALVLPPVGQ